MYSDTSVITTAAYIVIGLGVLYLALDWFIQIPYTLIIRKIIKEAARMIVTYRQPYKEMYNPSGFGLRPEIQKKVDAQAAHLMQVYNNEQQRIESYFYSNRLIDAQKKTRKIRLFKLAAALWDYDDFGRQDLFNSMRSSAETFGLPPEQILDIRKQMQGDLVGVYIIYNMTKKLYYVGQAKKLYLRVWQHFTGHGNGDVYADYKYGDKFMVRLLTLQASGYSDLDQLERDMIRQYNACTTGYNKTIGNGYTGANRRQWTTGTYSQNTYQNI